MRIGISAYDQPVTDLLSMCIAADEAGFDSVWLGEHVLAPRVFASEHPLDAPDAGSADDATVDRHSRRPIVDAAVRLVDPMVALAGVAASAPRLKLATGIFLLPLRHPLTVAQAGATLHDLSGGRFTLGVGIGWLKEEFAALDVPFSQRTGRFEEAIAVLRLAWRGGPFDFHGTHFAIDGVQIASRPVDVPIVLGGNTDPALERAVRIADGWLTSKVPSYDEACWLRDRLASISRRVGRVRHLETTWRVAEPSSRLLDRYAAGGFEDVLVMSYDVWHGRDAAERRTGLRRIADELGIAPDGSGRIEAGQGEQTV